MNDLKQTPVSSRDRSLLEDNRLRRENERTADERAPYRGLGMPAGATVIANRNAQYGELLPVDPTAGALVVRLPKGDAAKIGEKVTIKNYSGSTNKITVAAQPPDLIDKAAVKEFTTAWAWATFVLISPNAWVMLS